MIVKILFIAIYQFQYLIVISKGWTWLKKKLLHVRSGATPYVNFATYLCSLYFSKGTRLRIGNQ